jgi:hypothetical protein
VIEHLPNKQEVLSSNPHPLQTPHPLQKRRRMKRRSLESSHFMPTMLQISPLMINGFIYNSILNLFLITIT